MIQNMNQKMIIKLMNDIFSLKDSLEKLKNRKYDISITNTIDNLLIKFDEEQLRMLSKRQGLLIDNKLIRLFFLENVGFRCYNEKNEIYGKFSICINIERFMNNLYLEYISKYI